MRSLFTAAALCIAMQAASAQCVAPSVAATAKGQPAGTALTQAAAAPVPQRGELIKSAAAGTREPIVPVARVRVVGDDEHPRHGGTAMLLAALALMSGIALRRFGPSRQ